MESSEERRHRTDKVMNASPQTAIHIQSLTSLEHFERCVVLQLEVWGYSDGDVIPRRVFVVAQRIGGQVLGAFDGDNLVGFAMSLPGYREGKSYLHSHMLAVLPQYRNAGIGRRLKLAQRDEAIARGFDLMEWTFDPLEIRNSHLNINRLGAIVRRYQPDFYGPSSSPLQGGLPTDRLYAEWWLRSRHVTDLLQGEPQPQQVLERITVPHTIYQWKQDPQQRGLARTLQSNNRTALESAFQRGLAVVGYERDTQGNGSFLLGPWNNTSEI
ncbi:GNAT family N-acetyltransferase [Tunturiibacter gelidoferens]|uniref:Putative GNAT superfamily acetyltransferase n=2 Tax=Tunturiibacter TaxID=3154218 RepID=A0A7Y9T2C3_9BACT|nr:GNAT family N-acetyltransferase [Edaphobacter lichenicola]NYF51493.1 putative GNAT superfamily acetyltransferase [Edaphobacter lichenicola]